MNTDEVLQLFTSLPTQTTVLNCPVGDTTYRYERRNDDWRAGGYRWRQLGSAKRMKSSTADVKKNYFQINYHCSIQTCSASLSL